MSEKWRFKIYNIDINDVNAMKYSTFAQNLCAYGNFSGF